MEAHGDALLQLLVGGFGDHLTAAPEYGLCSTEKSHITSSPPLGPGSRSGADPVAEEAEVHRPSANYPSWA